MLYSYIYTNKQLILIIFYTGNRYGVLPASLQKDDGSENDASKAGNRKLQSQIVGNDNEDKVMEEIKRYVRLNFDMGNIT